MTASSLMIAPGFLLAWANGANDVSKGIATLVGGRATGYRPALAWGVFSTGAGALAASAVAQAMVTTFGSGLLPTSSWEQPRSAGAITRPRSQSPSIACTGSRAER
jgi:PiT family inorganic phosphate transporter